MNEADRVINQSKTQKMKKIANSNSAGLGDNMLLQAVGDGSGSGSRKKEHIWHKVYKTWYGPYGTYSGYTECLLCDDPEHWGYVVGDIDDNGHGHVDFNGDGYADNGYCQCYDCTGKRDEVYYNPDKEDNSYGDGYYGYDGEGEYWYCKYDDVDYDYGYDKEKPTVCPVCKSPDCQRVLNPNKKICTSYVSNYQPGMYQRYYDKDFMLSEMTKWSAKVYNPLEKKDVLQYHNYVEASGYRFADDTYGVYIDESNSKEGAESRMQAEYNPNTREKRTIYTGLGPDNGKVVKEYYHTHSESAKPSDTNPDGKGDIELAREVKGYGVTCYILFEGVSYLIE